jgi:hypothetical protein
MSIVPNELIYQWSLECWSSDPHASFAGEMPISYIANRAAQWALEQAITTCEAVHSQSSDEYDINGTAAASWCAASIRALMKGGESDEN